MADDLTRVRDRIDTVRTELQQAGDFLEFGASDRLDHKLTHIQREALRDELEALEELEKELIMEEAQA